MGAADGTWLELASGGAFAGWRFLCRKLLFRRFHDYEGFHGDVKMPFYVKT